jgi:hypothetical protein
VFFRVCSWLILSYEKAHKEEHPKQNHHEKRQNHQQKTAQICPGFLIPCVRRRAMRAEFRFCKEGAFTLWAEFDFHKVRISKKRVKIIKRLKV